MESSLRPVKIPPALDATSREVVGISVSRPHRQVDERIDVRPNEHICNGSGFLDKSFQARPEGVTEGETQVADRPLS